MKTHDIFCKSVLLFLFLPATIGFGQVEGKRGIVDQSRQVPDAQAQTVNADLGGGAVFVTYKTGKFIDNIFLEEELKEGKMLLANNAGEVEGKFRYNIFAQQMQYTSNDDTLAVAIPEEISSLLFDDKQFIFSEYVSHDKVNKGYFEVLNTGDCQLLLRREITHQLISLKPTNTAEDTDKYILKETYYIRKGTAAAFQVLCNKKCIVQALGEKSDAISKFIKEKHLKMKKQGDVIQVISYFNSLE
ncbi:MAG: hypothetical protein KAT48_10415 [Bacteroidales bacterium]|nr:hypothetical protein [Bacteroidales bacterium]